ncbi:MAG TPA: GNAT family protein [Vicinamibacterales bacterium]
MDTPQNTAIETTAPAVVVSAWRKSLPVLTASTFALRELRLSDAPSLLTMLTTEEVTRYISPPPSTVEGFERFILWTQRERAAGNYICFGIVPDGCDAAVGIFQVRRLEPSFATAEWGFALGQSYWGSGLFAAGALKIMEFAFETVGVRRLEARSAVQNGRGNGALLKIGATREGVLHKSFLRDGQYLDQVLWAIVDEDWRRVRITPGACVN